MMVTGWLEKLMIVNFLITFANETSIFDDGSYLHTEIFVK